MKAIWILAVLSGIVGGMILTAYVEHVNDRRFLEQVNDAVVVALNAIPSREALLTGWEQFKARCSGPGVSQDKQYSIVDPMDVQQRSASGGQRVFKPVHMNVTTGLDIASIAARTGLISIGNVHNNAVTGHELSGRCNPETPSEMYIVWNSALQRPHVCYCVQGAEHCSDPLLAGGDAQLNCIGGGNIEGIAKDCSSCSTPGYLC